MRPKTVGSNSLVYHPITRVVARNVNPVPKVNLSRTNVQTPDPRFGTTTAEWDGNENAAKKAADSNCKTNYTDKRFPYS